MNDFRILSIYTSKLCWPTCIQFRKVIIYLRSTISIGTKMQPDCMALVEILLVGPVCKLCWPINLKGHLNVLCEGVD